MPRVIAGTRRRLPLKTLEGKDTRPTQDRTKETLFNCIQGDIEGSRVLDLYAGSASLGIEALSRGAKSAVFVEASRPAISVIRENLSFTHFEDEGEVLAMKAADALSYLKRRGDSFDLIFMDPPYALHEEERILSLMKDSLLSENAIVVLEADRNRDFSFLERTGFEIFKQKDYKNNCHLFLRRMSE